MDPILLISVAAPWLGPSVAAWGNRSASARSALERFVVVVVAGLVLVHVFPQSIQLGGPWAALAALIGLVIPVLVHRGFHGHDRRSSEVSAAFLVALLALAVHSMIDGASLAAADRSERVGAMLVAAVVLHRLPAGVAIWWIMRPALPKLAAVLVLALDSAATLAGYVLANENLDPSSLGLLGIFEGLVVGTLLHVVLQHGPQDVRPRRAARWAGAMLGALVLVGLSIAHAEAIDRAAIEVAASIVIAVWAVARARPHDPSHHD